MNSLQPFELFLLLFALSCCLVRAEGEPAPSPGAQSGLEGSISLHGVSGGPVREGVPDFRPLANTTFLVTQDDRNVATFTTDDQGRFRIALPPGRYRVIRKDWKVRVGFYGPFEVDVPSGTMKSVHWDCETGMQ